MQGYMVVTIIFVDSGEEWGSCQFGMKIGMVIFGIKNGDEVPTAHADWSVLFQFQLVLK